LRRWARARRGGAAEAVSGDPATAAAAVLGVIAPERAGGAWRLALLAAIDFVRLVDQERRNYVVVVAVAVAVAVAEANLMGIWWGRLGRLWLWLCGVRAGRSGVLAIAA